MHFVGILDDSELADQNVLAWQQALETEGIELSVWRIHHRIGMSGGPFTNIVVRETGADIDGARMERLRQLHATAYLKLLPAIRLLPGARDLLDYLTRMDIPWGWRLAGEGKRRSRRCSCWVNMLPSASVITRDQVKYGRPDPDLLVAAAVRLAGALDSATVVGDSVWDVLAAWRARALGIGSLSGGELERAGAYCVYQDPLNLLRRIDEVGGRR